MIVVQNNRLELTNCGGESATFEKRPLLVPISVSGLSLRHEYRMPDCDEASVISSIWCSHVELDFAAFARSYVESVEEEEIDIYEEISHELKVLSGKASMKRIKMPFSLASCSIKEAAQESHNFLELVERGFFTIVNINIHLSSFLYSRLAELVYSGQMVDIKMDIKISGFDLGHKLGNGSSGVALESGERFDIGSVVTSTRNRNDEILSAISGLNKKLIKLIGQGDDDVT